MRPRARRSARLERGAGGVARARVLVATGARRRRTGRRWWRARSVCTTAPVAGSGSCPAWMASGLEVPSRSCSSMLAHVVLPCLRWTRALVRCRGASATDRRIAPVSRRRTAPRSTCQYVGAGEHAERPSPRTAPAAPARSASISMARSSFCPTPIVGRGANPSPSRRRRRVITRRLAVRWRSISSSSSTAPIDLGRGERRRVLAHGQLAHPVGAHLARSPCRPVSVGVDVEQRCRGWGCGCRGPRPTHCSHSSGEAVVGHPLVVEHPRQVAATRVGVEDHDDVVGRRRPWRP